MKDHIFIDNIINIKNIYSFFLALLPIIMILRVPFAGIGMGTLFLAASLPYVLLFVPYYKLTVLLNFPTGLFLYIIFRSLGSKAFSGAFLFAIALIHVWGAGHDSINVKLVRQVIENVAVIVSVILIIQTCFHYVFHINIQTLFPEILLAEYAGNMGYTIKGMFRPSAIFLEPAHFAQYTVIALASFVIKDAEDRRSDNWKFYTIAIGIICSTSGIGLGLTAGMIVFKVIFETCIKNQGRFSLNRILKYVPILIVAIGIAFQFEPVRMSYQRIFGEVEGYNAVRGRSVWWESTVDSLRGINIIIGVGPNHAYSNVFLTGLNNMIYSFGYLGLLLFVLSLLQLGLKRCKIELFSIALTIIYFAVFTSADVIGFIMLSFWLSIIAAPKNIDQLHKIRNDNKIIRKG